VWQQLLFRLHLPAALAPDADIECLEDWWMHCSAIVPKIILTRWRTLSVLTWRLLWKERNNRIFSALACTEATLTDKIVDELSQWRDAGVLGTSWPGRRVELRLFVVQGKAMHLSSSLLFDVVFKTAVLLLFST
jgi:hypothetical protein